MSITFFKYSAHQNTIGKKSLKLYRMDRKYIDFKLNEKNPIFGSGTKLPKINPIINVDIA